MADTERAFAARALVVGWKQSFLEFFADSAVGFDGAAGPARDQIRRNPDPPAGFQLLWEPRFGDISASGDLGFLTGPVTSINPARQPATRYSTYASVWKRQADGTFKVVIDVGATAPGPVEFAPGLMRADRSDRYIGNDTMDAATRALEAADLSLTRTTRVRQSIAYTGLIPIDGRLHRPGVMPLIGEPAARAWLAGQLAYSETLPRFAEVARSRDLGYTWGTYRIPTVLLRGGGSTTGESGFYARVWVRTRDGAWKVALDVVQPGAP